MADKQWPSLLARVEGTQMPPSRPTLAAVASKLVPPPKQAAAALGKETPLRRESVTAFGGAVVAGSAAALAAVLAAASGNLEAVAGRADVVLSRSAGICSAWPRWLRVAEAGGSASNPAMATAGRGGRRLPPMDLRHTAAEPAGKVVSDFD